MTNTARCEPPEKLRATSGYHWLRRTDDCGITPPAIWTWRMPEAVWRAQGIERTPDDMHHEWVAAVAPPADFRITVAQLRLALARALVANTPNAVVPIEPTTAMIVAAIERPDTSDNSNGLFYSFIYRAMVAAAQETSDR